MIIDRSFILPCWFSILALSLKQFRFQWNFNKIGISLISLCNHLHHCLDRNKLRD